MADLINLRTVRKQKKRSDKLKATKRAIEAPKIKKVDRISASANKLIEERRLEGHRLNLDSKKTDTPSDDA